MSDNHYMKDMDIQTVMTYLKNLSKKLKRQEGTIPFVEAIETAVDLLSTPIPIKSCPFCGGKAELVSSIESWVRCKDCGAMTKMKACDADAIEEWNRRVNDDTERSD